MSTTDAAASEAILVPLITTRAIRLIFVAAMCLLAVLALALPSTAVPGSFLAALHELVMHLPGVRAFARHSLFPVATSISYATAAAGGLLVAVVTLFARVRLGAMKAALPRWSGFMRVVGAVFLLMLLALALFRDPPGEPGRLSFWFFELVERNRFALLLWVEGILGFFSAALIWIFLEIGFLLGRVR